MRLYVWAPRAIQQDGPSHCPEGNRIERVWLILHANVTRNHRCRTMRRLMVRVHAYLAARKA